MNPLLRLFGQILCLLALSLPAFPALSAPSIDDYAAHPNVGMVAISPDGKTVAFRRRNGEQDLIVVYSLENNKVVRAVDVSSIKPRHLYFLDHSKVIMVVAEEDKRISGFRGSHSVSSAFALDTNTGELSQLLTPGDVIFKGQSGLGRIIGVSPDGQRVYMPAFVSSSRSTLNPGRALVEVDLESVRRPRVMDHGSEHSIDYFVDGEGKILVQEIFNNYADYHSLLVYKDDERKEIFRQQTSIPTLSVTALMPDRKSLVVMKDSETTDRVSYHTMSLADGSFSTPMFGRTDADVSSVLVDINRTAYGVQYSGFFPTYEFFDRRLTQRVKELQGRFPGHSVRLVDWTPDWKYLVMRVEGGGASGDYYLFDENDSGRFLASARPDITADDIHPVVVVEYEARDGMVIPALLTIPRDSAENPKQLPAVVLPHGGPQHHDVYGFDWMAQALAAQGYSVLQPQFRGSDGFGVQHRLAGRGEWGKKMQDDLTDGLELLVSQGLVDPQRVCIMGGSYGGYAALAGGAFTPDLYKCIVSINGVSDLRKMMRSERSDHGRHHWVLSYWKDIIAAGDDSKAVLQAASPAQFADKFEAPVLLLHGSKDEVVPYEQSKYMYKQLKKAKKPVELVKLKGEDHSLSKPETRTASLRAAIAFINEHIGGGEKL